MLGERWVYFCFLLSVLNPAFDYYFLDPSSFDVPWWLCCSWCTLYSVHRWVPQWDLKSVSDNSCANNRGRHGYLTLMMVSDNDSPFLMVGNRLPWIATAIIFLGEIHSAETCNFWFSRTISAPISAFDQVSREKENSLSWVQNIFSYMIYSTLMKIPRLIELKIPYIYSLLFVQTKCSKMLTWYWCWTK